jgi:hypothetical protein
MPFAPLLISLAIPEWLNEINARLPLRAGELLIASPPACG